MTLQHGAAAFTSAWISSSLLMMNVMTKRLLKLFVQSPKTELPKATHFQHEGRQKYKKNSCCKTGGDNEILQNLAYNERKLPDCSYQHIDCHIYLNVTNATDAMVTDAMVTDAIYYYCQTMYIRSVF